VRCSGCRSWVLSTSGSKNKMCNRWKDMYVFKKDHENCNHTGKKMKTCISLQKHCFSKKSKLTWMNIEPLLQVCSIAHSMWQTFEKKCTVEPRVSFCLTNIVIIILLLQFLFKWVPFCFRDFVSVACLFSCPNNFVWLSFNK